MIGCQAFTLIEVVPKCVYDFGVRQVNVTLFAVLGVLGSQDYLFLQRTVRVQNIADGEASEFFGPQTEPERAVEQGGIPQSLSG